ncbi:hypothetical protein MRX96_058143 [Rhipicephalus microplus]
MELELASAKRRRDSDDGAQEDETQVKSEVQRKVLEIEPTSRMGELLGYTKKPSDRCLQPCAHLRLRINRWLLRPTWSDSPPLLDQFEIQPTSRMGELLWVYQETVGPVPPARCQSPAMKKPLAVATDLE